MALSGLWIQAQLTTSVLTGPFSAVLGEMKAAFDKEMESHPGWAKEKLF